MKKKKTENNINSSDDDDSITDENACTYDELNRLFSNQYHLAFEECVSLKKSYILHLASPKNFNQIAATTSSQTIHLYDINTGLSRLRTPKCLDIISGPIVGVKYANMSPESMLISTNEGVMLIDLRSDDIVHTFIGE